MNSATSWPDVDDLHERLRVHVDALDYGAIASQIAADARIDPDEARDQLRKYVNESFVALDLVKPFLRPGIRILEIGSGIGFFADFLASAGYAVIELEPVGGGFEFIGAARRVLANGSTVEHLNIGVDDLSPDAHGCFDLVYSLNVLEHVPDWRHALDVAYDVLTTDGTMIQSCPNYSVPYDPHFGVPLVPFRPQTTARFLPKHIEESGLWRSLNWVTQRGVSKWAQQRGAQVDFKEGTLADVLDRLSTDSEFRRRHGRLGSIATSVARRDWIRRAIRRAPLSLTTPMVFSVKHPKHP